SGARGRAAGCGASWGRPSHLLSSCALVTHFCYALLSRTFGERPRRVRDKAGQAHGIEAHHLADVLLAIAELLQQADDLAEAVDRGGVFGLAEIGAEEGAIDAGGVDIALELFGRERLEARVDEHADRVLDIDAELDQAGKVLHRRADRVGRVIDQEPVAAPAP